MSNSELFSESEIAGIVRRAAELQEQESATGYVPGVTKDELSRMAAEAGIDPSFLEKAIAERKAGKEPTPKFEFREEVERVLPVELSPEDFYLVTDQVKLVPVTTTKGVTSGGVTQVGRSLQGQVSAAWDNPHFKVTSRGGRTKLQVWTSNGLAAAMAILWGVPLALTPVVGHAGGAVAGGVAAVACAVGSFLTFGWLSKKAQQTTRDVAKKMEDSILRAADEPAVRDRLASPETELPEASEDLDATS